MKEKSKVKKHSKVKMSEYPTPEEAKVIAAAERLMEETMARYDPSHDAFHGTHPLPFVSQSHSLTHSLTDTHHPLTRSHTQMPWS